MWHRGRQHCVASLYTTLWQYARKELLIIIKKKEGSLTLCNTKGNTIKILKSLQLRQHQDAYLITLSLQIFHARSWTCLRQRVSGNTNFLLGQHYGNSQRKCLLLVFNWSLDLVQCHCLGSLEYRLFRMSLCSGFSTLHGMETNACR